MMSEHTCEVLVMMCNFAVSDICHARFYLFCPSVASPLVQLIEVGLPPLSVTLPARDTTG